jgi:hypothetical protein
MRHSPPGLWERSAASPWRLATSHSIRDRTRRCILSPLRTRVVRATVSRASVLNRLESSELQPLFREVNEVVVLVGDQRDDDDLELVCECANPSCVASVRIRLDEYEGVRRFPTRFIVKPGHDSVASERIVEEAAGFVVVEKFGPAARAAIRLDPRRRRLSVVDSTRAVETPPGRR